MRFNPAELLDAADSHERAAEIVDSLNAHDFKGWKHLSESEKWDYADLEDELARLGYTR